MQQSLTRTPAPAPASATNKLLEWAGAILGLLGAGWIALNLDSSGWGFVAFLGSNLAWIAYALLTRTWGMLTMQAGFTLINLIGVTQWLM